MRAYSDLLKASLSIPSPQQDSKQIIDFSTQASKNSDQDSHKFDFT